MCRGEGSPRRGMHAVVRFLSPAPLRGTARWSLRTVELYRVVQIPAGHTPAPRPDLAPMRPSGSTAWSAAHAPRVATDRVMAPRLAVPLVVPLGRRLALLGRLRAMRLSSRRSGVAWGCATGRTPCHVQPRPRGFRRCSRAWHGCARGMFRDRAEVRGSGVRRAGSRSADWRLRRASIRCKPAPLVGAARHVLAGPLFGNLAPVFQPRSRVPKRLTPRSSSSRRCAAAAASSQPPSPPPQTLQLLPRCRSRLVAAAAWLQPPPSPPLKLATSTAGSGAAAAAVGAMQQPDPCAPVESSQVKRDSLALYSPSRAQNRWPPVSARHADGTHFRSNTGQECRGALVVKWLPARRFGWTCVPSARWAETAPDSVG